MSENIRVLNTGPNVLMIDSVGHSLGPGEIREVSPEDPETARHLEAGRLARVEEPEAEALPVVEAAPDETNDTSESGDTE